MNQKLRRHTPFTKNIANENYYEIEKESKFTARMKFRRVRVCY